jgi:hypothetical protein
MHSVIIVIMLSAVILSVLILNVIMMSVVIRNMMAHHGYDQKKFVVPFFVKSFPINFELKLGWLVFTNQLKIIP